MAQNPVVTFTMKNGDVFKAELYPEIAPQSVNNFISLIQKGFYNGLIFHRVIRGFMIQGGDPQGTGMGGPGYCIKGEFSSNGFKNDLKHTEGVLSMARSMFPDSAGSQFFIMHKNSPHLDGDYAAFGKIIEHRIIAKKKKYRYQQHKQCHFPFFPAKLCCNQIIYSVRKQNKTYRQHAVSNRYCRNSTHSGKKRNHIWKWCQAMSCVKCSIFSRIWDFTIHFRNIHTICCHSYIVRIISVRESKT